MRRTPDFVSTGDRVAVRATPRAATLISRCSRQAAWPTFVASSEGREPEGRMDALPRQVAGDREFAAGAARALTAVLADLRRTEMRPPEDETAAHVGSGDVFRLRWAPTLGRVDRLSRQLLAYAGRQSLVPEALGLTSFLSNLANALRSTLDVGIELFVDIGDDCLQCYVDASALEEALLTLVVNGRDAMPSGGRLQLTATAETVSDGSKGVALSICDSGHGMPDEFMMRAKRPFVTSKTYDRGRAWGSLPPTASRDSRMAASRYEPGRAAASARPCTCLSSPTSGQRRNCSLQTTRRSPNACRTSSRSSIQVHPSPRAPGEVNDCCGRSRNDGIASALTGERTDRTFASGGLRQASVDARA